MKFKAVGLVVGLMFLTGHVAANETSNRIEGVSEFLLERANDNWLYVTETQIRKNKLFECYFPTTYKQMTSGNLKLLLNAGKGVWKSVVEEDLDNLADRYLVKAITGDAFAKTASGLRDVYIESVLQRFSIEYKNQRFRLDQVPVDAEPELNSAISHFSSDLAKAFESLERVRLRAKNSPPQSGCIADNSIIRDAKEAVKQVENAIKRARDGRSDLRPVDEDLNAAFSLSSIDVAGVNDALIRLMALDSVELAELLSLTQSTAPKGFLMRVMEAEQIIRRMSELGVAPINVDTNSKEYTRFRRYALSVAVLSDAESVEQVKVALQEMTLPPVSFGLKRQPQESTVMITSYLGVAAGAEKNDESGSDDIYGLFAPIGIEYSYGLPNNQSFSVMLAPLDFAHPLSLELHDKDETVEWNDIVRPSLSITYGLKDYPFAIGVSVSRGRPLESETEKETQYFLFVAFDLPLFQVF